MCDAHVAQVLTYAPLPDTSTESAQFRTYGNEYYRFSCESAPLSVKITDFSASPSVEKDAATVRPTERQGLSIPIWYRRYIVARIVKF